MSRKQLPEQDRRIKISITINPTLFSKIDELYLNKSKYIECLIYNDFICNNQINKDFKL